MDTLYTEYCTEYIVYIRYWMYVLSTVLNIQYTLEVLGCIQYYIFVV